MKHRSLDTTLRLWIIGIVVFMYAALVFGQNQTSTGQVGPRGYTGARGPAGNVSIGTVTTGDPGTNVIITNVGTVSDAVLNITIPRGSAFLHGTTAPSNTLGQNGDYYINTTAGCLYGPKATGAWPGSCQPFAGATGPAGPTGPTGPTGPAGPGINSSTTVPNGAAVYPTVGGQTVRSTPFRIDQTTGSAATPGTFFTGADPTVSLGTIGASGWNRYNFANIPQTGVRLHDTRSGWGNTFCRNPNVSDIGAGNVCNFFTLFNDYPDSFTPGTVNSHSNAFYTNVQAVPGQYETNGPWSGSRNLSLNSTSYTSGIDQTLSWTCDYFGLGDGSCSYLYGHHWKGAIGGDDEGWWLHSEKAIDGDGQNENMIGVVTAFSQVGSGLTGLSSDHVNGIKYNSSGGPSPGQGHYAVLVKNSGGSSAAIYTGTAVTIDGADYTHGYNPSLVGQVKLSGASFAVSNTCKLTTIPTVNWNNQLPQATTLSCQMQGTATTMATGQACLVGGNHSERIQISAVSGSTGVGVTQTLTTEVRQKITQVFGQNPTVWQDTNGLCGSGITIGANAANGYQAHSRPMRQFFPVVGAIASDTVVYAVNMQGNTEGALPESWMDVMGNDEWYPESATVSIVGNGTTATATVTFPTGARYSDFNNRSVVISGTTNYNGTKVLLRGTNACCTTYTFASTATTTESGSVLGNTGRNTATIYPMTEILGVSDPDLTDAVMGHYLMVDKNVNFTWATGQTFEVGPYPYAPNGEAFDEQISNSHHTFGRQWNVHGTGISGPLYGAYMLDNSNPPEMYEGQGGFLRKPGAAWYFGGSWDTFFSFNRPSNPAGSAGLQGYTVFDLACPRTYTGDPIAQCQHGPADNYNLFKIYSKSANGVGGPPYLWFVNVPNDSVDMAMNLSYYSHGANGFKLGFTNYLSNPNYTNNQVYNDTTTVHVGNNSNFYVDGDAGGNAFTTNGVRGMFLSDAPNGAYGYSGLKFCHSKGDSDCFNFQLVNRDAGTHGLTLGQPLGGSFYEANSVGAERLNIPELMVDRTGYAYRFAGGYPVTIIAPPSAVYAGGGTTPNSNAYYLALISPDGIVGKPSKSVLNIAVPAAGLDATHTVTVTCPTAIQSDHPAGSTYMLYESGSGLPLNRSQVGVCPIGGTKVDNGTYGAMNLIDDIPNANAPMYAGHWMASLGGSYDFRSDPSNPASLDLSLTRESAGVLDVGKTRGAKDGAINAGQVNGVMYGSSLDPTGVTDSTAAIQALMDAAAANTNGNNTVELPAGKFLIADTVPLFLQNGVKLRGQSQGATKLVVSTKGLHGNVVSWTCTPTSGASCTSGGVAPFYITMTFASAPLAPVALMDIYASTSVASGLGVAGGCQISQLMGMGSIGQALSNATGLSNLVLDSGYTWTPSCSTVAGITTATTWQVRTSSTTGITANSGGSGSTWEWAIPGMTIYDARHATESHDFEVSDLTVDGQCNVCSTAGTTYSTFGIWLGHKSQPAGGVVSHGYFHDLTFQNFPVDGIHFNSDNDERLTNITLKNIGSNAIGGQAASNIIMDKIVATNIGFPFQGATGQYYSNGIGTGICCSGYHDITITNSSVQQSSDVNNVFFGLSFYQNGSSTDPAHKLFRGLTVKNFTQHEVCPTTTGNHGGVFTGFVDDMFLDIDDDVSACGTNSIATGTGFVEIGGSSNHVQGHNINVTWAGIDGAYTHANNIEIGPIKWDAPYAPINLFTISGAQGGVTTPCEIDNVDIHDVQGFYDMHQTTTPSGNGMGAFGGIGAGEGSIMCAIRNVKIHDNQIHAFNGTPVTIPISLAGNGNGTITNDSWEIYSNTFTGAWTGLFDPMCEYTSGGYSVSHSGTTAAFNVTHMSVHDNIGPWATGSLISSAYTTVTPFGTGSCTQAWFGADEYGKNRWNGVDYNREISGVTGTITNTANTCTNGTASSSLFKVGAFVRATRTDGALPLDTTTVKSSVIANGTATVRVCSGTTLEPAGTWNIQVTNPQ